MRETDMKEKILTDKKYGLRDFCTFLFLFILLAAC